MKPKIGDYFYYFSDDGQKILRKIKVMTKNQKFEWYYGWAHVSELEPNPDYPKNSRVKWIKK